MEKQKLFRETPAGVQLRAGTFRGNSVWHSEDGGKFWWSGWMFSHSAEVTREELVELASSILRDLAK